MRYSLTLRASGESFRNLRGAGTAQLSAAVAWQGVVVVERIIASFLPCRDAHSFKLRLQDSGCACRVAGRQRGNGRPFRLFPGPSLARIMRKSGRPSAKPSGSVWCSCLPWQFSAYCSNHNIIRLFFQRGNFTPEATRLMAMVLFYYSLSLLPYAFIRILSFHMFARLEGGLYLRLALFLYRSQCGFDLLYTAVFRLGAKGIPLGCSAAPWLLRGLPTIATSANCGTFSTGHLRFSLPRFCLGL